VAGENGIFNRDISAIANIDEATIRSSMLSFTNDAMFKSLYNNMGTPDSDIPVIICVLRFIFVGNGRKAPPVTVNVFSSMGRSGDFRNLIEVPDNRGVHIQVAVFISNNDICLRRSVVLLEPKTYIAFT
jgi:hypothetical protein